MIPFNLTPRRRETLETLQKLTGAGAAVHYSVVAARMRISAWTAYGLLRELEKTGLVVRSYALDSTRKLGGRSRILFAPALQRPSFGVEEAQVALRAAFERFAPIGDEAAAARAFLAEAGADIGFQLGFWLSRLQAAGRNAQDAALAVLEGAAVPRVKLQALASMGLGTTLARLQRAGLAARMTTAAGRFSILLEDAGRASEEQLGALVEAAATLERTAVPRRRMIAR